MDQAIHNLELELDALKKKRKAEKLAEKVNTRWMKIEDHLPPSEAVRVLVWLDGGIERCWHDAGRFYRFDGSWFYTEKERVEGVTHWCLCDWLNAGAWPQHGPGIKNRLAYLWRKTIWKTTDTVNDLRTGSWGNKAQLSKKAVFYQDAQGKLVQGGPENWAAPAGFQKIVCNNAHEAERYSERLRRMDSAAHERLQAEREKVEAPMREELRSDLRHRMANARNATNREFLRRSLETIDGQGNRMAYKRESYMHCEGFEDGR